MRFAEFDYLGLASGSGNSVVEFDDSGPEFGPVARTECGNLGVLLVAMLNCRFCNFDKRTDSPGVQGMGKCKGCGKLGRMLPREGSVSAYHFSLLLSPVVSVWDCIVRKMRYSYRPEWV
ncbi:hypothetical protein ACOSP7_027550 [Xanthoceras sorbifolium]